jgi:hypothetical protein
MVLQRSDLEVGANKWKRVLMADSKKILSGVFVSTSLAKIAMLTHRQG